MGFKLFFKPKLHYRVKWRLVSKRTLPERSISHRVQTPPGALDLNIGDPVAWLLILILSLVHKSSGTAFAVKGGVSILGLSDWSSHQWSQVGIQCWHSSFPAQGAPQRHFKTIFASSHYYQDRLAHAPAPFNSAKLLKLLLYTLLPSIPANSAKAWKITD